MFLIDDAFFPTSGIKNYGSVGFS